MNINTLIVPYHIALSQTNELSVEFGFLSSDVRGKKITHKFCLII